MGLISGPTILTSLSLFHITLGFFFITNPSVLADQALVLIIGQSMGLPRERTFEKTSPALAFLGAVFIYFGITDLVAVSVPEEISQWHWGTQAPVRFFLSAALSLYTWLFSSSSPMIASRSAYKPGGWGEGLKNRLVFSWAFLEMVTWFWIFVTLREERREFAVKVARRKAADEDRL
ncbi:hypothetical protein CJF32_00008541 [Rutstroemia sp. NJR-2017a WRK4]|nr:hypothetical protein CJF32_00008541 [Rutstroemia sp. NJR-2017a WRK4]